MELSVIFLLAFRGGANEEVRKVMNDLARGVSEHKMVLEKV